jgi:CRP-like cAMP-binding protein
MTFRTLKEGDFFGEENLLLGGIPDYSVLCLTDGS